MISASILRASWPQGPASRQSGAALVIGLLLLLVLTILAVTGITTATLELQMAGNEQYRERAFQAAETAIEQAIQTATFNTTVPFTVTDVRVSADDDENEDTYSFTMEYDNETGATLVPGGGFSLGTGFQAYHFNVVAEGRSERGSVSEHVQSVYVIGPGGT
jgi:type IV pilus assembly protein PilX